MVIKADDERLNWAEKEIIKHIGDKIYKNKNNNQTKTMQNKEKIWTEEKVILAFKEAIRTLKKLPPAKVRGYFNIWPQVIYLV